jgi:hypothetical protein
MTCSQFKYYSRKYCTIYVHNSNQRNVGQFTVQRQIQLLTLYYVPSSKMNNHYFTTQYSPFSLSNGSKLWSQWGVNWIFTMYGHFSLQTGRAMTQAVSCQLLIAEARARPWVSSCETSGGQDSTGKYFSPSTSVLPCQYHFTCAPYSFSSICHLFQKDKRAKKPGNLQKSNPLSKIGEHWT